MPPAVGSAEAGGGGARFVQGRLSTMASSAAIAAGAIVLAIRTHRNLR
jgi:hypothetical protein